MAPLAGDRLRGGDRVTPGAPAACPPAPGAAGTGRPLPRVSRRTQVTAPQESLTRGFVPGRADKTIRCHSRRGARDPSRQGAGEGDGVCSFRSWNGRRTSGDAALLVRVPVRVWVTRRGGGEPAPRPGNSWRLLLLVEETGGGGRGSCWRVGGGAVGWWGRRVVGEMQRSRSRAHPVGEAAAQRGSEGRRRRGPTAPACSAGGGRWWPVVTGGQHPLPTGESLRLSGDSGSRLPTSWCER